MTDHTPYIAAALAAALTDGDAWQVDRIDALDAPADEIDRALAAYLWGGQR